VKGNIRRSPCGVRGEGFNWTIQTCNRWPCDFSFPWWSRKVHGMITQLYGGL